MSNLAHFCNRIGIDSQLLRVVKKDNILYNKKTAEPLSDWVIFNAIHNQLRDDLVFHSFCDDKNFYADPVDIGSPMTPILPRNQIVSLSNECNTFKAVDNRYSIELNGQTYFTNLFNKAGIDESKYKMIYPFEDIGNFSFDIHFESGVLLLKRTSTSLINRANLDVLDADKGSYSARLNFHHGANQKIHFAPHYVTDFSDPINRKLMLINRVVDDLCIDLQRIVGFLKSNIRQKPIVSDRLKGHYLNMTDTADGIQVDFETFLKFYITQENSIKLARKFIERYKDYNDPIAIHVMKILNIIDPVSLENMMEQDVYSFYNDIEAFENYLKIFEMNVI